MPVYGVQIAAEPDWMASLVLLQLVGTWWRKENMPFPSMATLAVRSGVSERQIQRSITCGSRLTD
jgi:hypothetical protein